MYIYTTPNQSLLYNPVSFVSLLGSGFLKIKFSFLRVRFMYFLKLWASTLISKACSDVFGMSFESYITNVIKGPKI